MSAPDWYALIATDRGMPEGWRWFKLERKGDGAHSVIIVGGGVPTRTYASGKRKGKPDWRGVAHDEMVIGTAELTARMERWEAETGKCHRCGGDGAETIGWSTNGGAKTRTCSRCKGKGAKPDGAS